MAEQGVMFVGFLQQPGGGPYFLGHWDPEELSSLHSSPSPIHRHPFSANISPTDPGEPLPKDVQADHCSCESQELDHGAVESNKQDHITSGTREPDFSRGKHTPYLAHSPEKSNDQILTSQTGFKGCTNEPQSHLKPDADTVQNASDAQDDQLGHSPTETAGTIRLQERKLPEVQQHFTDSTEKHFYLSNQRERRVSSSDSWLSSPELDCHHDRKSDSTRADGQRRMKTHNNNHIRLKSWEKNKGATSPPAQASE